jgi:hypothetical protein
MDIPTDEGDINFYRCIDCTHATNNSPGSSWTNIQGGSFTSDRQVNYSNSGNFDFITIDAPVYEILGNTSDCPTTVDSFSISDAGGSTTDSDGEDYATIGFAV